MKLFLNHNFLPNGYCYVWQPELVWLNALSDIVIVLSCIIIPIAIWIKLSKIEKPVPHKWLLIVFTALIGLIGGVHIFSLISIWYPLYYLEGILKIFMASLFLACAVLAFPLVPVIIRQFRPDDDEQTG